MATQKFEPGIVTPEQLEEYRQRYEAAKMATMQADRLYVGAYIAWCNEMAELRKAESVYVWAQKGMVQVEEVNDDATKP